MPSKENSRHSHHVDNDRRDTARPVEEEKQGRAKINTVGAINKKI
jgi:hypothetical protein